MASAKKTESFIVTRRIQPDQSQVTFLEDTFLRLDHLYNDILAEAKRRGDALRADPEYLATVKKYQETRDFLSHIEKQLDRWYEQFEEESDSLKKDVLQDKIRMSSLELEKTKNELSSLKKTLKGFCTSMGFSEYSLHAYAGRLKKEKYEDKIGINIVQKIATAAWKAEEKVFYGNGHKVHFRKRGETTSFEEKSAKSGIIYKPADDSRKHKKWEHVVIMGHPMHLKPIRKKDLWLAKAMEHEIKYCRVVRKPHGKIYHYFLQIVMEGQPPVKHPIGKGTAGLDPGVSTMTYYTGENLEMLTLSPNIAYYQKKIKEASVVYERRRRLNNPQNYNPDGTIKKDTEDFKKVWIHTKGMQDAAMELKTAYRKQSEYVKQQNGYETNRILMQINSLNEEVMDYSALAKRAKKCKRQKRSSVVKTKQGKKKTIFKYKRRKRFGASILKHAPAAFLRILEQKLHRQGGTVLYINTRKYKASQYDHVSNAYEKHTLGERTKVVGEHLVQRDCYSAFLLKHASDATKPDRDSCIKDFDNFLSCQQKLIEYLIKATGDKTGNFGLRDFKKMDSQYQLLV